MEGRHELLRFCSPPILVVSVVAALVAIRLAYVLWRTGKPHLATVARRRRARTLIVLGSGGHTAEMIGVVSALQRGWFSPRFYVAAATDSMSLQKARVLEECFLQEENSIETIGADKFLQIYRSREVGQSYITSVGTTLIAMAHAFWLILRIRPEVIICNGPGTCIPLCFAAFLLKVVGLRWSYIFYIESIARVRKLSLSGLLLYKLHLADQFVVQWPQLQQKHPGAKYVGRLM